MLGHGDKPEWGGGHIETHAYYGLGREAWVLGTLKATP